MGVEGVSVAACNSKQTHLDRTLSVVSEILVLASIKVKSSRMNRR